MVSKHTRRRCITNVFKWLPQLGELAQSLLHDICGPLIDFAVLVGIAADGTFYSLGKRHRGHGRSPDTTPSSQPTWSTVHLAAKDRPGEDACLCLSLGLLCMCGFLQHHTAFQLCLHWLKICVLQNLSNVFNILTKQTD